MQVALDASISRFFEDRVVLPPLASVCRQIRKKMNGKYQRDATLNPETPIHALVTNFNFHSLSRWLDKHSRDLKDKMDAPRGLCITLMLQSPDAAADLSTPKGLPESRTTTSDIASTDLASYVGDRNAGPLPLDGSRRTRSVKVDVVPGARPRFKLEPVNSLQGTILSGPLNPGAEVLRRTTSDMYKNFLRILEQNLEEWLRTWTSCVGDNDTSKFSEIGEHRDGTFYGQADRLGTCYKIGWRIGIVHREHSASRAEDHCSFRCLKSAGAYYRGDICDQVMFGPMVNILARTNHQPSPGSYREMCEWLRTEMVDFHFSEAHDYPDSFQKAFDDDDEGGLACDRSWSPCYRAYTKVVRFYQKIDRFNIKNKVFERETERLWLDEDLSSYLQHGTKRAVPNEFSSEVDHWEKRRRVSSWEENELPHLIFKMERWSLAA